MLCCCLPIENDTVPGRNVTAPVALVVIVLSEVSDVVLVVEQCLLLLL